MTPRLSRHLPAAVLATLATGASGAWAQQGTFSPPQGCEGTLTIQNRGCLMTHLWTCEADPEGQDLASRAAEAAAQAAAAKPKVKPPPAENTSVRFVGLHWVGVGRGGGG